ncbi:MAG: hypothetical protein HYZ58_01395 [Acidobacteria bacterium]|nr:hypothetical protein [Acidobacteriota bacterium]
MQLRTANVGVDAITVNADGITLTDKRMRARFAARFGARQADEGAGAIRQDDVRAAFNSPFWPFVLCSTSVGQEGLDFHLYCHAVVHWNLPSNPVDLEQREGRVHRYKGHAVRKNAVRLYGPGALRGADPDPWAYVFDQAARDPSRGVSDLVPFWVLSAEGGARIERHVPTLPLSRDSERVELLRRALTVYRMAFGQARQEDLVAYLQQRIPTEDIARVSEELRIDLAPPPSAPISATEQELADLARRRLATDRVEDEPLAPASASVRVSRPLTVEDAVDLLDQFCVLQPEDSTITVDLVRDLLDRFVVLRSSQGVSV